MKELHFCLFGKDSGVQSLTSRIADVSQIQCPEKIADTVKLEFVPMLTDLSLVRSFPATVDLLYAGLTRTVGPAADPEHGLGGQLVYAGELHSAGCALAVAANIAGAASLAATADVAAQRQAVRDGVIDFLVTSIDEALRILKNEIRKRQSIAVCVRLSPEAAEREMLSRGVLPDLLPPGALDARQYDPFLEQGSHQVEPLSAERNETILSWGVGAAQTFWLPKLDGVLVGCLGESETFARRWLRLAPRYLGRLGQGNRILRCRTVVAHEFVRRVQEQVAQKEIDAQVEIGLSNGGHCERRTYSPVVAQPSQAALGRSTLAQFRFGSRVH